MQAGAMFTLLAPAVAVLTLFAALLVYSGLKKCSPGNELMQRIAGFISTGAMAYLKTQYRILLVFVLVVSALLFLFVNRATSVAFIAGALLSMLAGYVGMKAATTGNVRTANAARESLSGALAAAFSSGSVMGFAVAGLGLLGVSAFYLCFHDIDSIRLVMSAILGIEVTLESVAGFGMGASSIALFARVGGGIFTKSADVGADLVGKLEAGIPEDDPRNPAVIADNVGDNVGDVAGMGADLFESYVGCIIAAIVLAVSLPSAAVSSLFSLAGHDGLHLGRQTLIALPLILAALGTMASLVGALFVRLQRRTSPHSVLRNGTFLSAALSIILGWLFISRSGLGTGVFWAMTCGVVVGTCIGLVTEYFTSSRPVRKIAEATGTGTATTVIEGIARGNGIRPDPDAPHCRCCHCKSQPCRYIRHCNRRARNAHERGDDHVGRRLRSGGRQRGRYRKHGRAFRRGSAPDR